MTAPESAPNTELRVAVIGLGYFSQFHLDAWNASTDVKLVAVCDPDQTTLNDICSRYDVPGFNEAADLFNQCDPDIVDIVAPPDAHEKLVKLATRKDRLLVCQKPFCSSLAIAEATATEVDKAGARLIIHENFRFQPWYRTLKEVLDSGELGTVYQCRFDLRPGDGRGTDAYLARQPAFQNMQQFLVRETGVHFIDLFRWMFGDIETVYADLRQLNPAISGEDAGNLIFNHENGVVSVLDGNRLSDHAAENHRMTMGELTINAEHATVRLDGNGKLWKRPFQSNEEHAVTLTHTVDPSSFGGGCVNALIQHVIKARLGKGSLENDVANYLPVMRVADACYESNNRGEKIMVKKSI
ncbi:MAG: Gfo/Idh/MocA family oxidoreductase [Granulosicoccus sp.]|nr:Gfo/Idh/MocA family oxidoreductase [Granulosicoccus sp.]